MAIDAEIQLTTQFCDVLNRMLTMFRIVTISKIGFTLIIKPPMVSLCPKEVQWWVKEKCEADFVYLYEGCGKT